jgi:hypothetical protein
MSPSQSHLLIARAEGSFKAATEPAHLAEDNAGQPRRQAGFAPERLEVREGLEVALLDHILRFNIISGVPTGNSIKAPVVARHDDPEGIRISASGIGDEIHIIENRKVGTCCRCILHLTPAVSSLGFSKTWSGSRPSADRVREALRRNVS